MKKITKLCGTKKSIFMLNNEDRIQLTKNEIYICKKCERVTKDKIFICYPEIKKES